MDPLPVGLIGFGGHGSEVAEGLDEADSVAFEAVSDLDDERLANARSQYGVDTYADAGSLLGRDDIEAVAVITRADAHAPLSIRAMEAGKDVFVAKPIAANVLEAREMVATARRTGQKGAIEYQRRFRPDNWTMKEAVSEFDVMQLRLTEQRSMFRNRYLQPGYAFGLMDSVSHQIDISNWVADRRPVAVNASLSYGTFTNAEAIDEINLQIEYATGTTASIMASMGGSGLQEVFQVVGENGSAQRISGEDVQVRDVEFSESWGEQKERQRISEPRVVSHDPPGKRPTVGAVDAFVRYVRGGPSESNVATFEDGFDALLVAKAAEKSHETGETVYLSDLESEISTV